MATDQLRREVESGVSNVEIDWFLRGKLPTTPRPPPAHTTTTTTHHEPAALKPTHSIMNDQNKEVGHALSRTKSLPTAASPPLVAPVAKKKGFFRSMFKKKDTDSGSDRSNSASPQPYHATASDARKQDVGTIHRSKSLSSSDDDLDPRLEEFLRYYKSKGLDKLQKDANPKLPTTTPHSHLKIDDFTLSSSSHSTASSNSSLSSSITSKLKTRKLDVLGRPIPPHPAKCSLPPAIVKTNHLEQPKSKEPPTSSKLNFLRRHVSNVSSEVSLSRSDTPADSISSILPKPVIIPGLENLPLLKRVAFDIPVFFNDPPQQIPSRTPRKGEVEILKDGTIVIHKLTAAEKKQLLSNSGGGLVVGGTGPLKILAKGSDPKAPEDVIKRSEEHRPTEDELHDAQKHSIEVAAAEAAAGARAKEAPNDLRRTITNNEEEVIVDDEASRINIDKPMIRHNKSSISLASSIKTESIDGSYPSDDVDVPLDVLYTRCCHLREILPIPATLKQLKAGSSDPISLLQLRNPKPSLVEVLTFSDFVSVAPILCVSLDGVSLSSEMFRILLSSLVHRKKLEKLTLRNSQIDETGWKLLCWFLTKNQTLSRLDLTQVPSLVTNVQKPSKTNITNIARMECDPNSRSDMNWNLLSAALLSRGGIDEIVINGAKMSDAEFKNFVEMGISLKTTKLGLAYNDLSEIQCRTLAECTDFQRIVGIDLGYNDLSGAKLSPFIERIHRENVSESNLKFISLNSANLTNEHGEMDEFISSFASFKNLRYIDLSNNKRLFPSLMISLAENLPLYENLGRLHLDYNDLSQNVLVAFAELIPFCKRLTNISLLGNKLDNVSVGSLTSALRLSKSVISLDINYDEISPKFREQIALYTVRNMQHEVYGKNNNPELKDLQEEISHLLRSSDLDPDSKSDPTIISKFLERATKIRKSIHETIDELFKLRIQGELNTEGKEALIRFCFIDSSIEKGLKLLQQKSPIFQSCLSQNDKSVDLIDPSLISHGSSSNILLSSYVNDTGHSELMPFGVSNNSHDSDAIHGDAEEIKDDQVRARSADNLKLKEEASALKIGTLIRDSDIVHTLTEEGIDSIKDGLNNEQLKDILLETSDLDNVVDILESLKQKGISVSKIYKKDGQHCDQTPILSGNNVGLDLETLKNTKSNINRQKQEKEVIVSDTDSETDLENEDPDDINHAYDEILDHLERVRTNN